jgi:alpha-tubulin suppressor-like RCC1 family protein
MRRAALGRSRGVESANAHRSSGPRGVVRVCSRASILVALVATLALFAAAAQAQAESNIVGFGQNGHGQLGAGYQDAREIAPVSVPGMSNVVQIAEGFNSTLALLSNGTVESWGENNYGQLGVGQPHNPIRCFTPQLIPGLSEVVAIAAGGNHDMALMKNGQVRTWGATQDGEFGNGLQGTTAQEEAEPVEGAEPPEEEEAGLTVDEHGCEYKPEQAAQHPFHGSSSDALHTPLLPETPVTSITIGGKSDYALLATGQVEAWGDNADGQLGNKMATSTEAEACNKTIPTMEKPVKGTNESQAEFEVRQKAYKEYEENRKTEKREYFEENYYATPSHCSLICYTEQGIDSCLTKPHVVEEVTTEPELGLLGAHPMNTVLAIAAGGESLYALVEREEPVSHVKFTRVEGLGNNGKGQLGNGAEHGKENNPVAVEVAGSRGYTKIGAGEKESFGVASNGSLYGWGDATGNELIGSGESKSCGNGKCYRSPHLLTYSGGGLPSGTVEQAVGGGDDSFVIVNHQAYAFGSNENGELGLGVKTLKVTSATPIEKIGEVKEVHAGELRTTVLLAKNTAPPPLLELVPEPRALRLNWTFTATKPKIRETPVNTLKGFGNEFSKLEEPKNVQTFAWPNSTEPTPLRTDTPYRVSIGATANGLNETRVIYGTPLAREGFPETRILDTFQRAAENPMSEGGKWSKLAWARSIGQIYSLNFGWVPAEGGLEAPEAEASGAYWNANEFNEPAVSTRMYAENRRDYVALWCDTTGTGSKNGYRLKVVGSSTNGNFAFKLVLEKWTEGSVTQLGESPEVMFKGSSFENVVGITASGGTVRGWYGTTEENMAVKVEGHDETFSHGFVGIEGTDHTAFGETYFGAT